MGTTTLQDFCANEKYFLYFLYFVQSVFLLIQSFLILSGGTFDKSVFKGYAN